MRFLGIDHGDVRIGLALSDESGLIVRPLQIVKHVTREIDAATIARIAKEKEVGKIIVGLPLDSEGAIGHQARKVQRWAEALQSIIDIPIEFYDESFSSLEADSAPPKRNADANDDRAAAVMLQNYLDSQRQSLGGRDEGGEGEISG